MSAGLVKAKIICTNVFDLEYIHFGLEMYVLIIFFISPI